MGLIVLLEAFAMAPEVIDVVVLGRVRASTYSRIREQSTTRPWSRASAC
jgi:hypothetical protein